MNAIEFIIAGMLAAATPFLLAALGELVVERSGVINLGLEGLMALGAAIAFIVVYQSGSHILGFVAAGIVSALLACPTAAPSSQTAHQIPVAPEPVKKKKAAAPSNLSNLAL